MEGAIKVYRDGVSYCTCKDESCLYPPEIMKRMRECGYKFYQNGKIYKPNKKVRDKNESKC